MAAKSTNGGIYTDILTEFSQGMNSSVLPQLLPKSQAAFAINVTFRGAFATHRPPYIKMVLDFPSAEVQAAVERGLYQGGWWYRPDFGPLQIVAQISGRLFTFTKTTPGNYAVVEITIPGDPNDASATQVWMWQSEKWLIITDGSVKLPIFYDGVSSRRSFGPSALVATGTVFNPVAPPAIGSSVVVKIGSPYTGPLNVPVLFNGEHYQIISAVTIPASDPVPSPPGSAYTVRLLARYIKTPGAIASGSDVVVKPNQIGYSTQPFTFTLDGSSGGLITQRYSADIYNSGQPPDGSRIRIGVDDFIINFISYATFGSLAHVQSFPGQVLHQYSYGIGTLISYSSNQGPDVVVGQTGTSFTPSANGDIVGLSVPYTGPDGQVVWIGDNQFLIYAYTAPPTPPTPGTPEAYYITLVNLTDTGVGNYANPSTILSTPELPAGRMGAYGLGQTWMSLTDGISFIASDPVGFSSGLPIYNYRDAVLRTTGADSFLAASGGSFRLPNSGQIINSMTFTANLDTSLGQGSLEVGTDSGMFSCLAPFDYTLTVLPPVILTQSLIGFGPLAQNSTVLANSDVIFRSFVGLGSLILARRDFGEWGNTPISREMTRTFSQDAESLLPYGSAVVFDNRLLDTCAPNVSGQGVFHMGLVALNFDLISSLRGKAPPVFDGLWTGLNALQIINIQSGSEARAFIFGYNITDSKIELYELLKSQDRVYFDNGTIPIKWIIETPVLFNQDIKPLAELVRITNGELWLQDIVGTVNVKVQYRPDFYSGSHQPACWEDWTEFQICAEAVGDNVRPGYRTRIGLGEPDGDRCQEGNNRPFRVGHFFQFRLEFTGSAKFMAMRVEAVVQPQSSFAPPICQADDPLCTPNPELPELVIP